MSKFYLSNAALIICLSVFLSASATAQIYTIPTATPAPAPAPAPAPTPTPTATPAPMPTPTASFPSPTASPTVQTTLPLAPSVTTTSTGTTANAIPGYFATSSNYGPARTVAYAIAPFAAVAAAYFLTGRHQIEIHPYAGFYWPGTADFSDTSVHLRDEGVYGAKVTAYVTDKIGLEGNLGYVSHFESRFAPTVVDQSFGIQQHSVWGLVYDVNGVYDFGKRPVFGSRISPYVIAGIGGLSTEVRGAPAALIGGSFYTTDPATGATVLAPTHTVTVHDNTAFLSINYGGGIKALNLWGPVGLRADIRGRTFPNFRGETLTWPEASGGLTFSFGQK